MLLPDVRTERDPDLMTMCTMLQAFDDGLFDRLGEGDLQDPNWARLQTIAWSAQAAGRSESSLRELVEAGSRIDWARTAAEWDVVRRQLEFLREHC